MATHHVYVHVKKHMKNIKAPCREDDKTPERGLGEHLSPIGADDETFYGDGNNNIIRDKDTHPNPIRDHQ